MTRAADMRTPWRRLALLLVGCALLLRMAVPAGWMPQVGAGQVTLSWCADSGFSGPAALGQARALLAGAIGEPAPDQHKTGDQPCAFAMAAQPLAPADALALPLRGLRAEPVRHVRLAPMPGRGLAAPPPFATGPPLLG